MPGPSKLIGGNLQAGFYGEVPANELISGDELARRISLNAGTSQFSNEPWLKFSYMGKVEFVAKKPFRHSISWDSINVANAVTGQRTIDIGGKTYKIRLMKGKTEGKQDDSSSISGNINKGSEWNKLMLPIHENAPLSWNYKDNIISPTENWNINYKNNDLIKRIDGGAARTWCQENGDKYNSKITRGYYAIEFSSAFDSNRIDKDLCWRPVLELVD